MNYCELFQQHQKSMRRAVSKFLRRNPSMIRNKDDVFSEASMYLWVAIHKYDNKRSDNIESFLYNAIYLDLMTWFKGWIRHNRIVSTDPVSLYDAAKTNDDFHRHLVEEGITYEYIFQRAQSVESPTTKNRKITLTHSDKTYSTAPAKDDLQEDFSRYTLEEMSQRYGVSSRTVGRWLKHYGIGRHIKNAPDRETLVNLYQTMTNKELAAHFNVTKAVVHGWLQKHKIYKNNNTT